MKQTILLFLIFANIANVFAQDTIFWETAQKKTSALEIIKFSDDSYKLEECFYLDNKRFVHKDRTKIYKFTNDSILIITYKGKEMTYIYHKNDTIHSVSEIQEGRVVATGNVTSLVPLIKHGKFTYYNPNGTVILYRSYNKNRYVKVEAHQQELGEVLLIAEQMPRFPGGEVALQKFIAENIEYPKMAQDCKIHGKVYVRFVVTKTGEVANIEIVRSVDVLLDEATIRVISTLPNFIPAKQNRSPVNIWYVVPIDFKLN